MTNAAVPLVNDAILGPDPSDEAAVRIRATSCSACGETGIGTLPACGNCGSAEVAQILLPTTGTVWSYTVAHHAPPGAWDSELGMPRTLALVTIDGVRVYGPVLGAPDGLEIGAQVRVVPIELTSPEGEVAGAFAFEKEVHA